MGILKDSGGVCRICHEPAPAGRYVCPPCDRRQFEALGLPWSGEPARVAAVPTVNNARPIPHSLPFLSSLPLMSSLSPVTPPQWATLWGVSRRTGFNIPLSGGWYAGPADGGLPPAYRTLGDRGGERVYRTLPLEVVVAFISFWGPAGDGGPWSHRRDWEHDPRNFPAWFAARIEGGWRVEFRDGSWVFFGPPGGLQAQPVSGAMPPVGLLEVKAGHLDVPLGHGQGAVAQQDLQVERIAAPSQILSRSRVPETMRMYPQPQAPAQPAEHLLDGVGGEWLAIVFEEGPG